jgi:very-short-patch-repair endonuclease
MAIKDKIEVWQRDLIDMSKRNTLLYFHATGVRVSGLPLPIADTVPLFRAITRQGNSTNKSKSRYIEPSDLGFPDPQENPGPLRLLERLRTQARDDQKERGIHTLYLVFGMLNWTEVAHSQEWVVSPLIFIPVTFQRGVSGHYILVINEDEDIEINPVLHEKLYNDFHIRLPTWQEIVTAINAASTSASASEGEKAPCVSAKSAKDPKDPVIPTLDDVLKHIQSALEQLPDFAKAKWAITPDACLGRFSFTKLIMRQDLQRNQETALAHPILRRIAGEHGALREPSELIPAERLDERVHPRDTLAILDADSSQQEAIQAAIAGQSFVLQGPPGTGKSQTIANIIAESLARGKKVLFVSEKMAALEVVRRRLETAGLGEFLLDLHDAKRNKKDFINELQAAVRQARIRPSNQESVEWERRSAELERRRTQLNAYVRELHIPRFALQISAFEAHGRRARLANASTSDAPLGDVTQLTYSDLIDRCDALEALLDYTDVLDHYPTHSWRMTPLTSLSGDQSSALDYHFGLLSKALGHADEVLTELKARLGEDDPITLQWANNALDRARLALTSPMPPRHWLNPSRVESLSRLFQHGATAASAYHEAHKRLDGRYQETIYTLDHNALLETLTEAPKPALAIIQTRPGEDGRDTILRERSTLDGHLHACEELLPAFSVSAATAAKLLGEPTPESIAHVRAIVERAVVVAASPVPPKTWLDADFYAEARIIALEAVERAEWARQTHTYLEKRYTASFFTTDLSAISARFRERHTSMLRFLNPQYYLDCRTLNQYAQPGVALTRQQLGEDALLIARLHEYDQWRQDHRADHARIFGRYFLGDQTDWAHIREIITWTDSFHNVYGEQGAPEPARRLATGSVSERSPLASVSRTLADLSQQWNSERGWMEQALVTNRIVQGYDDLDSAPVNALTQKLAKLHARLGEFWQAADTLNKTTRGVPAQTYNQMTQDLENARAAREYTTWIAEHGDELRRQLHSRFQDTRTDWSAALEHLEWIRRFIALYPDGVPTSLAAWITTIPQVQDPQRDPHTIQTSVRDTLERAGQALETITAEIPHITTALPLSELPGGAQSFERTPLVELRERVDTLRTSIPQLKRWVDCGQAIERCQQLGLGPFVSAALLKQPFPRDIIHIFERRFYTLWLDAARRESPILANFSGDIQATAIRNFRELDKEHMKLASARLVSSLRRSRHNVYLRATSSSDTARSDDDRDFARTYIQLTREAEKKRHPAIREIVRRVGPALIELMPCWMMSPLSVSQFIETAEPIFDLVIFDEASQVLPEDAICAIIRGKQLIVVGDDKQLPPTSFFSKSLSDMGDEDDEDSDSAVSQRTESILKELMAANFTPRSLKWHYRSRHESLIAFSNSEFYGDQLITFPGPERHHHDGVKFVHVADGVYDRSNTRTNRREAERVVDELIEIVRRDHKSSIGVVALSGAQQAAIREALDSRFKSHPELAHLRDRLDEESDAKDAFFIKNLETVQGDERDIILLSVGYGNDRNGKLHANFGPINKPGGERRLNVAVTRARKRMIVVSSIRANDLPPTPSSAGAQTFRRYLDFAERGPAALRADPTNATSDSGRDFGSPFELAVYEALKARGLHVDKQVGCSSYYIDLAIRDDQQPDRYLLGIECDGRTYHSSKTARDRDRLRQAHLEGLGWHIHRIWSSDWIADPDREIGKILEALAHARMRTPIRHTTEEAG